MMSDLKGRRKQETPPVGGVSGSLRSWRCKVGGNGITGAATWTILLKDPDENNG